MVGELRYGDQPHGRSSMVCLLMPRGDRTDPLVQMFSCRIKIEKGGIRIRGTEYFWHRKRRDGYTPKTKGKVERLVQTSLREWASAKSYRSSAQRTAALQPFIHSYNWHRPRSALAHQTPMIRVPALNDLMKLNT